MDTNKANTMESNVSGIFKNFSSFISSISDHEHCFDYIDEKHMLSSDFSILNMFDKENMELYYATKKTTYLDADGVEEYNHNKAKHIQVEAILLSDIGIHYTCKRDKSIVKKEVYRWDNIIRFQEEGNWLNVIETGENKNFVSFSLLVGGKNQLHKKKWLALFNAIIGKQPQLKNISQSQKSEDEKNDGIRHDAQSTKQIIKDKYKGLITSLEKTKSKIERFDARNTELVKLQLDFIKGITTQIDEVSKVMEQTINGMVWDNLVIAFFGETNAGKSTIIETLRILFDPQKQESANDGLIVGDGQADFTKTYDEYHLNIFGKPFTLIDVPGIEGKEEDFKDDIKRALQQAHVVFYVQGHNKKPDSATAEKIKKYLNDWVNVYSIYNVRGGASNYDECEERESLFTSDVDKTYTLIEDTFKDILGVVYKGNIAIQALLAMCAKAHFAANRNDLTKTQKKLVSYFGSADEVFKFSHFQEIIYLIQSKTEHFDEELISANKQKLVALCNHVNDDISKLVDAKTIGIQKLVENLKQYQNVIKQVAQDTKHHLSANVISENDRLFASLQKDMCAAIDNTDLDNLEEKLRYQVSVFKNKYEKAMQQLVSKEIIKMNDSLQAKQKQYLDCFKCVPNIEIDSVSIQVIDMENIMDNLEYTFGDFLKNAASLGVAVGLGALGGPIGMGIGVAVWGLKKIFFDGSEYAENQNKQNAKNELVRQLHFNKQHAQKQLREEMEYCKDLINGKITDLIDVVDRDMKHINNIKATLDMVSKQIKDYSVNIQNM